MSSGRVALFCTWTSDYIADSANTEEVGLTAAKVGV